MSEYTPGPWRWELNLQSWQLQLCGGRPTFDKTVLGFKRYGMQGAIATFRTDIDLMVSANVFAKIVPGREHHADWFQAIDHPDAHLIAAAPDLFVALQKLVACGQAGGPCDVPGHKCDCLDVAQAAMKKAVHGY